MEDQGLRWCGVDGRIGCGSWIEKQDRRNARTQETGGERKSSSLLAWMWVGFLTVALDSFLNKEGKRERERKEIIKGMHK